LETKIRSQDHRLRTSAIPVKVGRVNSNILAFASLSDEFSDGAV
jgi:hypothetical protein